MQTQFIIQIAFIFIPEDTLLFKIHIIIINHSIHSEV
jgi:hypothetical protein